MKRLGLVCIAALGAWPLAPVACGSSSGPPAIGAGDDSSVSVDSTIGGGDGTAPDGSSQDGSKGDSRAGTDGAGSDGSGPDSGRDAGPPVEAGPALCDPTHAWLIKGVDTSVPAFGQFGGVSQDELTVAWTTASGSIQVADRPTRTDDFGVPVTVDTGTPALATDRVALSWSGLVAIAVAADRSTLVEFARPSRGAGWAVASTGDLVNVNAWSGNGGGSFSEPVFGDDGSSLYYLFALPAQAPSLIDSVWDVQAGQWTAGTVNSNAALLSVDATHRRRPTGGSFDALTLFFFDETTGIERAAWRSTPTSAFSQFVDIGAIPEAAPNTACDRIYAQAPDPEGGGEGLAYAY